MADERRKPPKGGRRGGSIFPRVALTEAVDYAERLVRKTHGGKQPAANILLGVFDNKGGMGNVRASAMKQYGLMEGETKTGYVASDLARSLVAAPREERASLLAKMFLKPRIFKAVFETFHGDRVTRAKLRQRAQHLGVHPDSAEECVNAFVDSLVLSELGSADGDDVVLETVPAVASPATESEPTEEQDVSSNGDETDFQTTPLEDGNGNPGTNAGHPPVGRPNVNVSISLDSSLDTEKLEKQLALLKRFGVF